MKCSATIEKLEQNEPVRIVAFGDSLTQGWMTRKGYVDFLHEMLLERFNDNIEMINRGIPGNTSDDGLERLRRDVLDRDPDLVLIQFALNDAYMGSSPGRLKNNIKSMVVRIRLDTAAEILLLTSCSIYNEAEDRMADTFYSAITGLGTEEHLPVAEVHTYWKNKIRSGIDHRSLVQGDMVHPTIAGYKLMAEAVMEKF